jgi:aquaporin Z
MCPPNHFRARQDAQVPQSKLPDAGVHLQAWGCELLGTALLLLGGLSAIRIDFGPHSPLEGLSTSPRLLITGLLFAGSGSLIAISPLGRRSGAHLNPVVTLAFWTQKTVHWHDLLGYAVSQLLGALLGTGLVLLVWGHAAVRLGVTQPGSGTSPMGVVAIEMIMTALLTLAILLMTSSARTARWTPLLLWGLIAALVWQGAPYTGTSLNPARSAGPALIAPHLAHLGLYIAGPLLGSALAVASYALLRDLHTVTAKLFHDPRYPSTLASQLPTSGGSPQLPDGCSPSSPPTTGHRRDLPNWPQTQGDDGHRRPGPL